MDSHATRPSLLARLRDSADDGAWREFDERYRELILRYCRLRGLQASDAEDVRQNVLVSLASSMKRFQYDPARGRFHAYLGRVVGNAIRRLLQQQRQSPHFGGPWEVAQDPSSDHDALDELWEREWIAHHYRTAFEVLKRSLEPKSLAIFERLLIGDSPETTAQAFQVHVDAVYKVKQRVRARMEQLIGQQIREENGEVGT